MTQEDLAEAADLHRTEIGRFERAERNIGILTVRRVLAALGKSWIDLGRELEARDPLNRATRRSGRRA